MERGSEQPGVPPRPHRGPVRVAVAGGGSQTAATAAWAGRGSPGGGRLVARELTLGARRSPAQEAGVGCPERVTKGGKPRAV